MRGENDKCNARKTNDGNDEFTHRCLPSVVFDDDFFGRLRGGLSVAISSSFDTHSGWKTSMSQALDSSSDRVRFFVVLASSSAPLSSLFSVVSTSLFPSGSVGVAVFANGMFSFFLSAFHFIGVFSLTRNMSAPSSPKISLFVAL